MLNTFLCDELDSNALKMVYAKWKGDPVDPPQFKLALSNLLSYGIYLSPDAVFGKQGDPAPTFSAASDEEVDAAFQSLLAMKEGAPDKVRKLGDGTFLKLILPIVLKLLAGFLI